MTRSSGLPVSAPVCALLTGFIFYYGVVVVPLIRDNTRLQSAVQRVEREVEGTAEMCEEQVMELQHFHTEQEHEIHRLSQHGESLSHRLEHVLAHHDAMLQEQQLVEKQLRKLHQDNVQLKEEGQALKDGRDMIHSHFSEQHQEMLSMRELVAQLQADNQQLHRLNEQKSMSHDSLHEQHQQQQQSIQAITSRLAACEREAEVLRSKNRSLQHMPFLAHPHPHPHPHPQAHPHPHPHPHHVQPQHGGSQLPATSHAPQVPQQQLQQQPVSDASAAAAGPPAAAAVQQQPLSQPSVHTSSAEAQLSAAAAA